MFNFSNTRLVFVVALILFIISSSTMAACSHKKKRIDFYPAEYRFPDTGIGNGKTFIYRNVADTSDLSFEDIKIITEGEADYLLTKQYSQKSAITSQKYTMDHEIIESYIIFKGDTNVFKLNVVKNEIIDDGSRLGKAISIGEYKTYDFIFTIRNEEYFLKDTAINWKGLKLDCIKTRSTTWLKLESKSDPSANKNLKKVSDGYFAKGFGLIRYSGHSEEGSGTMELIEIRDISAR